MVPVSWTPTGEPVVQEEVGPAEAEWLLYTPPILGLESASLKYLKAQRSIESSDTACQLEGDCMGQPV
jgi:hypothetical protein